jgi:hypothetical protein
MQFDAIIDAFETLGHFPGEAVEAAREDREILIPRFVNFVKSYVAGDPATRARHGAIFLIFHLLGEWRAKQAYEPLTRLLRLPSDIVEKSLGDSLTETGHRVMASVYDGNSEPLRQVILDPDANEYARSSMCETLAILVLQGELARDDCERFLEEGFAQLKPQGTCFVWCGWADAIATLAIHRLKPLVKTAYDREYIDIACSEYDDFESDFAMAVARGAGAMPETSGRNTPFDSVDEIAGWHCFTKAFTAKAEEQSDDDEDWLPEEMFAARKPATNLNRDIGRNDPCPCGSGKKFKKCCLS